MRTVAKLVGIALASASWAGCQAAPSGPPAPAAETASGPATAVAPGGWFETASPAAGLTFSHVNGMSGQFYFPEMLSPGLGLFDFDNDNDLDVYVVQGEMLGEGKTWKDAVLPVPDDTPLNGRLFRNDLRINPDGTRTLHFVDVTEQSGIEARGYGMGVAAADYNNDGCADLYLTFVGRNRLYRNNCNGTFTDVSKDSRTDSAGWAVSAAFLDYDRDGWLDLYVGHYVHYDIKNDQVCRGLTGRRDYCTPSVYPAQPDRLFHNQRNGTFADVTASALLGGTFGPALGVATADFNNDGWIDIYVANDTKPNLLWINQRDGTFHDTGLLAGAALTAEGKAEASMGVDAGDFDNDGDDDLIVSELPAQGSNLFVNDGTGQFEDRSAGTGVTALTLGYSGFGTGWIDVDNDGWLDVIQVNGSIQAIDGQPGPFPYAERKLLLRNTGAGRFVDVTRDAGDGFAAPEVSRGMAIGDIDNDGDSDVIVHNLNGQPRLLLNRGESRHHWMCLRLVGEDGKRDMLGARIQLTRPSAPTLNRRVRSDGSYGSANDPRVLAGLGTSPASPDARVTWPDGRVEQWSGLPINRCTTLREGSGTKAR